MREFAESSLVSRVFRSGGVALCAVLLTLLAVLEPLVKWICTTVLVLGLAVSVVFEVSAVGPHFPFLRIAGISMGFGVILVVYCGVVALLVDTNKDRQGNSSQV